MLLYQEENYIKMFAIKYNFYIIKYNTNNKVIIYLKHLLLKLYFNVFFVNIYRYE